MAVTNEKSFSFKAETQKVLKIIINSLYQHKEVFLRELLSNASDALNKARIKQLTSEKIFDPNIELKIEIIIDKDNSTLTIRDSGIGMNQKELKNNLGTIAKSGTEEFVKALENKNGDPLIGMFGVGFYSSFLVADEVEVITRSYSPSSRAWKWESSGESSYNISEAEREHRGIDVILHIKEDYKEYLDEFKVKNLVKKYSNYVEFPIMLGEETLNEQKAIWRTSPSEVTEEQYKDFYHFLGQFGDPLIKLHVSVDMPIQFFAILYIPALRPRNSAMEKEWGLRLYNKKVLIEENNKDLLPEYMRFIVGVVDAEDLDLNVSREVLQNTKIQRQINKYLQKKILDELEKLAKEDEEKYHDFFKEFGPFLKEGIAQNDKNKDRLIDLLRFYSTADDGNDGTVSLVKYVERMKLGQKEFYYLTGLDLDVVKKSPHLDYYKKEGYEVLLLGEPIDSFLMMHLTEYQEKKFFLIDQDETSDEETETKESDDKDEDSEDKKKEKTGPFAPLLNKFIEVLGSKVTDVKTSDRLVNNVARLVTPKGGLSSDLQRAMKIMESSGGSPGLNLPMMGKILQINTENEIIKSLNELVQSGKKEDLIKMIIEQIHDNARIADGDTPDFLEMTGRIENIIKQSIS